MWKIIGLIESRSGDVEFLPEWAIGKPNEFPAHNDAAAVADALQAHVEKLKTDALRRAPGVGGAGPAIRYFVLPAIDDNIQKQIHGGNVVAPAPPQPPSISFSPPRA